LPEYSQGPYDAPAARVGAGLEGWELFQYMDKYNITVAVPMGNTVGAYGGWITGGGHAIVSSIHGLGSDQPLKLQVVTADGRFITADPDTNEDLYYALRGGGPGMPIIFFSGGDMSFHSCFLIPVLTISYR
jgi:FAD/FMN-containing dehydrogenase